MNVWFFSCKNVFFHWISSLGYLFFSCDQRQKQETGNKFKGALFDRRVQRIAEKKTFEQISPVLKRQYMNIAENINIFICTRFETFKLARDLTVPKARQMNLIFSGIIHVFYL